MSAAEALVLFESIHRHEDHDPDLGHLGLVDSAERSVLWGISTSLESVLAEPFAANYVELLASARAEVRPDEE